MRRANPAEGAGPIFAGEPPRYSANGYLRGLIRAVASATNGSSGQ